MKITKGRLKQIIKEELENLSVEESYQPIPQGAAAIEDNPGGAISHIDSQLVNMGDNLNALVRDIDRLDGRFEKLKTDVKYLQKDLTFHITRFSVIAFFPKYVLEHSLRFDKFYHFLALLL